MSGVWKTKYGPRRVRNDPPTLEEAILAARGLSDDVHEQVEDVNVTVAFTGRGGVHRAVVVERKPSRRVVLAGRTARP
jgi:hypothetical protein